MSILNEVAEKVGITELQAKHVSELLLEKLHKNLVGYKGLNGDYLGEQAHYDLSNKGFYHLLGILEQFYQKYDWNEGSISEFLRRIPPTEEWEALSKEIATWNWSKK